eukprot:SAG31_NODE_7271_length_1737_cov_1.117216_1_plen_265_part_01
MHMSGGEAGLDRLMSAAQSVAPSVVADPEEQARIFDHANPSLLETLSTVASNVPKIDVDTMHARYAALLGMKPTSTADLLAFANSPMAHAAEENLAFARTQLVNLKLAPSKRVPVSEQLTSWLQLVGTGMAPGLALNIDSVGGFLCCSKPTMVGQVTTAAAAASKKSTEAGNAGCTKAILGLCSSAPDDAAKKKAKKVGPPTITFAQVTTLGEALDDDKNGVSCCGPSCRSFGLLMHADGFGHLGSSSRRRNCKRLDRCWHIGSR